MRRLLLAALLLCSCGGGRAIRGTGDPGSEPHVCIERFVAYERLPDVHHVEIEARLESGEVFFEVQYGQQNDCPAGCFTSRAVGVLRDCDRVGWLVVDDYDDTHPERLRWYRPDDDDLLLAPATAEELRRTSRYFFDGTFSRWLRSPRSRAAR